MEVAGRVVQSQESHPEQAESGDVTLASDPGSGTRGAGQSRGRGGSSLTMPSSLPQADTLTFPFQYNTRRIIHALVKEKLNKLEKGDK